MFNIYIYEKNQQEQEKKQKEKQFFEKYNMKRKSKHLNNNLPYRE